MRQLTFSSFLLPSALAAPVAIGNYAMSVDVGTSHDWMRLPKLLSAGEGLFASLLDQATHCRSGELAGVVRTDKKHAIAYCVDATTLVCDGSHDVACLEADQFSGLLSCEQHLESCELLSDRGVNTAGMPVTAESRALLVNQGLSSHNAPLHAEAGAVLIHSLYPADALVNLRDRLTSTQRRMASLRLSLTSYDECPCATLPCCNDFDADCIDMPPCSMTPSCGCDTCDTGCGTSMLGPEVCPCGAPGCNCGMQETCVEDSCDDACECHPDHCVCPRRSCSCEGDHCSCWSHDNCSCQGDHCKCHKYNSRKRHEIIDPETGLKYRDPITQCQEALENVYGESAGFATISRWQGSLPRPLHACSCFLSQGAYGLPDGAVLSEEITGSVRD